MRFDRLARYWACLLLSLLAGCAATMHQTLKPEDRAQINAVHLHVVIPQEGFTISAAAPGFAAAGGLIAAMIDASVQQSRQQELTAKLQPTLDRLLDIDVRADWNRLLRTPPALPFALASTEMGSLVPTADQHSARINRLSQGDAYLRIMVYYAYDPESRVFGTRSVATLWRRGEQAPVFSAPILFHGRPIDPEADVVASMREQVAIALDQTMQMVRIGMAMPADAKPPREKFRVWNQRAQVAVEGEVVGRHAGWKLVRMPTSGSFVSAPE